MDNIRIQLFLDDTTKLIHKKAYYDHYDMSHSALVWQGREPYPETHHIEEDIWIKRNGKGK